ncbi:MAG: monofunctional biosynthetic peptidoglycan transglycosylase, partial [Bacteroidales bacterium]|nr:monofunctional biosynthetic peptidoglycan transglycosylase [Bacteroidales bacterium]
EMKRFLRIVLLYIPLLLIGLSVLWVVALKWIPVVRTPLMDIRAREFRGDDGYKCRKDWVKLENISDNLVMAVLSSEDSRFLDHNGFDMVEIRNAVNERKSGKRVRGASTISQQTAKNVFLTPSRTMFRKALEAYFTVLIEKIWGKRRIMEVYLNVVELGKGIYGAEAAAQYYYKVPASKLSAKESAMLAACLPSPLKRNPTRPTDYLRQRSSKIQSLMRKVARPEWL